jgi:hypothetical protein
MRGLTCVLACLFLVVAFLPAAADAQCPRCGNAAVTACDPQPTPADPIATTAPVTFGPCIERSVLVRRSGPFWSRGPARRIVSWPFRAVGRRCG